MSTKRRQLPLSFSHPHDLDHIVPLAEQAAEYEFFGDHERYRECVARANRELNRAERCFFAGILAARRSEEP